MSSHVRLYPKDARGSGELRELRGGPIDDLAVYASKYRLNVQAWHRNGTVAGERDDGL